MDLCLPLLYPQISSLNRDFFPLCAVTLVLKEVNQYCALKSPGTIVGKYIAFSYFCSLNVLLDIIPEHPLLHHKKKKKKKEKKDAILSCEPRIDFF